MPTSRQSSAVDVVYPPLGTEVEHPSSLGVDVVHPPSTSVSAVRSPSADSDVTRPMPIGGTHLPSMGASVVGPTSAEASRQSVLRICLARSQLLVLMILQAQPGLRRLMLVANLELLLLPTSHLRGPDPSQPTLASMLPCVRMSRYIRQLRL